MQSIKTWQQAQAKLNSIKEADPTAESKLSEAFPQTLEASSEPIAFVEARSSSQQTDPLLSEAVTHSVAAEKANDQRQKQQS